MVGLYISSFPNHRENTLVLIMYQQFSTRWRASGENELMNQNKDASWTVGVPVVFFNCTHGVYLGKDGESSLCYTTSSERAEFIANELNNLMLLQKERASLLFHIANLRHLYLQLHGGYVKNTRSVTNLLAPSIQYLEKLERKMDNEQS